MLESLYKEALNRNTHCASNCQTLDQGVEFPEAEAEIRKFADDFPDASDEFRLGSDIAAGCQHKNRRLVVADHVDVFVVGRTLERLLDRPQFSSVRRAVLDLLAVVEGVLAVRYLPA